MKLETFSPETFLQLKLLIHSSVEEAIDKIWKGKTNGPTSQDQDYLSAEEAANFLKIKLNSIYSKVEKGELPHYRSGKRKLLFSRKELEVFIMSTKMKSMEEIEREAEEYIQNRRS